MNETYFIKEKSIDLIKRFLNLKNINLNIEAILSNVFVNSDYLEELPNDIIESIIFDAYDGSVSTLKKIITRLEKNYELILGRLLKTLLKKYLDYGIIKFFEDFFYYFNLCYENKNLKEELKKIIDSYLISDLYREARLKTVKNFFLNLEIAIKDNNESRIFDYINFLYSRLLNLNERNRISLYLLFKQEEKEIEKELNEEEFLSLKYFCKNEDLEYKEIIIQHFNKKYLEILEKRQGYADKLSAIVLNITKSLFDKFNNKEIFYSYIFSLIIKCYDLIRNHRSLIIRIENIIYNQINLKWEIFGYITIFAERFLKQPENRAYYKPENVFRDTFEFLYKIKLSEEDFDLIKKYYKNKISIKELNKLKISQIEYFKEILDDFKNIYTGFTFNDCYILKFDKEFIEQSWELNFIKNINEILLIFSKHQFNDYKIPCPICGSLNISGNSFPKIGIRSWECKNSLCGERSKTNRGKRYSERTIFMQDSIYDLSKENIIPKDIINKWRKDIVEISNYKEIYEMIIKYLSYADDKIFIIDETVNTSRIIEEIKEFAKNQKRIVNFITPSDFLDYKFDRKLFDDFLTLQNFSYINHFITKQIIFEEKHQNNKKFDVIYEFNKKAKLIHGDCYNILKQLKPNSIDCMVTSPPYYNAREYSQWSNLYNYLNEMYKINSAAFYALKPGGVFVYNIGDIFGNQNTTVKSKMGESRIPLGSYTILLFLIAGFELIEDFIWNKGEPQSYRHKNDGNYTPYYQKPANVYEHIFVFKKKGAPLRLNKNRNENPWKDNIPKFSPVIKIDANGNNKYGHSAPFPIDIPLFACKCFINEREIILDPFAGSSTSVLVAYDNNRIGIGIEILKDYILLSYKKAKERKVQIDLLSEELGINEINALIKRNGLNNQILKDNRQLFLDKFIN